MGNDMLPGPARQCAGSDESGVVEFGQLGDEVVKPVSHPHERGVGPNHGVHTPFSPRLRWRDAAYRPVLSKTPRFILRHFVDPSTRDYPWDAVASTYLAPLSKWM